MLTRVGVTHKKPQWGTGCTELADHRQYAVNQQLTSRSRIAIDFYVKPLRAQHEVPLQAGAFWMGKERRGVNLFGVNHKCDELADERQFSRTDRRGRLGRQKKFMQRKFLHGCGAFLKKAALIGAIQIKNKLLIEAGKRDTPRKTQLVPHDFRGGMTPAPRLTCHLARDKMTPSSSTRG